MTRLGTIRRALAERRKALPGRLSHGSSVTSRRRTGAAGRRAGAHRRPAVDRRAAGRALLGRRRCRADRQPSPAAWPAGAVGVADRQRRGVRWPGRRAARRCATGQHGRRDAARISRRRATSLVVTSTFGDGGPPTTARLLGRLQRQRRTERSTVCVTPCSASGTGPTTTSAATPVAGPRLAELGATKLLERAECEAYDDEPMHEWADAVSRLLSGSAAPAALRGGIATVTRTTDRSPNRSPAPSPCSPAGPQPVLTGPALGKEVRQFGFDISEHDVAYRRATRSASSPATPPRWSTMARRHRSAR